MNIELAISQRFGRVNRQLHPVVLINDIHATESGGLHFVAKIDTKRRSFIEQFYIPALMRPDLEHGGRNRSLDDKFKLTI